MMNTARSCFNDLGIKQHLLTNSYDIPTNSMPNLVTHTHIYIYIYIKSVVHMRVILIQ